MTLIVDGFNIAHAWPETQRLFAEGVDKVIEALTGDLKTIHDGRGISVVVVYDGIGSELRQREPFSDASFREIFSPESATADAVIEQMVSAAEDSSSFTVASRDQFVVDAVEALGATGISPAVLRDWLEASRRATKRKLRKLSDESESAWGNRIPL